LDPGVELFVGCVGLPPVRIGDTGVAIEAVGRGAVLVGGVLVELLVVGVVEVAVAGVVVVVVAGEGGVVVVVAVVVVVVAEELFSSK